MSPLRWRVFVRAIGGIVGGVWIYMQKKELRYWWEYGRENQNKLVEWKALVDTVGIKSAHLDDKFLF